MVLNTEAIQNAIDEVSNAGGDAISGKTYAQFHDALIDAEKAMKENVIAAINVFKG